MNDRVHTHIQYLLACPSPEAACHEYNRDRRLQVGADRLEVDEELATLTGLNQGDP